MRREAEHAGQHSPLANYLALAHHSDNTLADSLRTVQQGHAEHPDVLFTCQAQEAMSRAHVNRLAAVVRRYDEEDDESVEEPAHLRAAGVGEVRSGPVGPLRDLQNLHLLATMVQTTWTVIGQAAQGLRDDELFRSVEAGPHGHRTTDLGLHPADEGGRPAGSGHRPVTVLSRATAVRAGFRRPCSCRCLARTVPSSLRRSSGRLRAPRAGFHP